MLRRRRLLAVAGVAALVLAAAVATLDRLFPPPLARLSDLSATVLDDDGGLLRAYTASDGSWRLPAAAGQVDPLRWGFVV